MPTKLELEAQNASLKSKVKELTEKVSKLDTGSGELIERAYGSYFHDDKGKWMLVELKFDPKTKSAQVISEEVAGDYSLVTFKMEEAIAKDMLEKMRR